MNWTELLLGVFFPARCLGCGKAAPFGKVFCKGCESKAPRFHYRRRYSLPWTDTEWLFVLSPLPYTGEFRQALHRYKFRNEKTLARAFGKLMAQTAEIDGVLFDAAAWVPMTAEKKRQRGYDQSELLAKAVAREMKIPCLPLLRKVRETGIQHELSAPERKKNVEGAYRFREKAAEPLGGLSGKRVLLIDDIVTTGATLKECAGALYAAGAREVTGLCAADAQLGGVEKEAGQN